MQLFGTKKTTGETLPDPSAYETARRKSAEQYRDKLGEWRDGLREGMAAVASMREMLGRTSQMGIYADDVDSTIIDARKAMLALHRRLALDLLNIEEQIRGCEAVEIK